MTRQEALEETAKTLKAIMAHMDNPGPPMYGMAMPADLYAAAKQALDALAMADS